MYDPRSCIRNASSQSNTQNYTYMCLLWRVRASQYNIGLPGKVMGANGAAATRDPSGRAAPFFYFFSPPIHRVFFFMLLSEKLTNSETAVHNTTLITLHNAIIAVSAFVAAYITYITQYHYNYYFTGNCYRVFKITLQPVVGGVLSNILIVLSPPPPPHTCCFCRCVAAVRLLPLRGSDVIWYTILYKIKLFYYAYIDNAYA